MNLPKNKADIYPLNRQADFDANVHSLGKSCAFSSDSAAIAAGDSLVVLQQIKSSSIDLILTDPPYHTTKKQNIYGDTSFEADEDYFEWIEGLVIQCKRILRDNGSMYLFCSSDMAPFLYVRMSKHMNMHNIITWTKPNEPGYDGWKQKMKKTSLRRWYPHSEKVIYCSPATNGNLKRSPLGVFLKECRVKCGLSSHQLTEMIGAYRRVNNGGTVSNWESGRNIPSREQYQKVCDALCATKKIKLMPAYEDVVRAFCVDPQNTFVDVWDQMNVRQYRGKHPAEKPLDLLDLIVQTSSYEGDIVLDAFLGSGSTVISACRNNRKSIGIEIDPEWVNYAIHRLHREKSQGEGINMRKSHNELQGLPLFESG